MGISLEKASLSALFLETLFYGMFFTLYWPTLFILLKKTGIKRQLLIPVATLLLCIATAHLIIDFVRVLEAFVFKANMISVDAYYTNLAAPLDLTRAALYAMQTTLADGVLIWRCYVLNGRSLLVAIPGLIVLLTNAATGYYIVWALSRANSDESATIVFTNLHSWITTFFVLTMFTSVTCTTLIAWRIYRTRRLMTDGFAVFLPLLIVIVESGALYTTSVLATLLAYLTGSIFPVLDAVTPIVGIVFCLVVLQVHFQLFRERGARDAGFSMKPTTARTTKETGTAHCWDVGRKGKPTIDSRSDCLLLSYNWSCVVGFVLFFPK